MLASIDFCRGSTCRNPLWQELSPKNCRYRFTSLVGQQPAGRIRQWPDLFTLLSQKAIKSTFLTDAIELAESTLLDHFDDVALVDFEDDDLVAEKLDQTRIAKLIQFAITKLYEQQNDTSSDLGLLWIHSRGLKTFWDAPYELRTIPCDEDDPEPSTSPIPPRKLLDEDTDPDVLFDAICGVSAQAAVLDFAWSYINELIDEQTQANQGNPAQPFVMLMGVDGYPMGEHNAIGNIDENLYAERLHVPLIIRPSNLPIGRRLPHLVQPWQVSSFLATCLESAAPEVDPFWHEPPRVSVDWAPGHRLAWAASDNEYALITPAWTSRVWVAANLIQNPNRADLSVDAITPMAMWEVFVNPDDRFQQNDIASRVEPTVKKLCEIATRLRDALYGSEGRIDVADFKPRWSIPSVMNYCNSFDKQILLALNGG